MKKTPVPQTMLRRFIADCDGQDMVEYALLVAVVALAMTAAITGFRDVIDSIWVTLSGRLSS